MQRQAETFPITASYLVHSQSEEQEKNTKLESVMMMSNES